VQFLHPDFSIAQREITREIRRLHEDSAKENLARIQAQKEFQTRTNAAKLSQAYERIDDFRQSREFLSRQRVESRIQAKIVQDYALQELRWNIPISKEYSRVHHVVETVLDPPSVSAKTVAKKLASRDKSAAVRAVSPTLSEAGVNAASTSK
jgi:hypothetical protein